MVKKFLQKIHLDSVYSYQKDFSRILPRERINSWLDLGCHDGKFLKFLSNSINFNGRLTGVELSDKHIKKAASKGIKVIKSDLSNKLPFRSGSFDLVTVSHLIEHISRLDVFLSEIKRVLKKDGRFIVGTENLSAWHNIGALVFGLYPFSCDITDQKKFGNPFSLSEGVKDTPDYHRTVFNLRALCEFLEYYDFRIIKKIGTAYYPLPSFLGNFMPKIDPTHSPFITILSVKK